MFNREGPISIATPPPSSSDTTSSNASSSNATSQKKPPVREKPAVRPSYYSERSSIWKYVLGIAASVYIIASSYFMYFTYSVYEVRPRITALEQKQKALEAQQADLNKHLHARLSEVKESLSSEVDTTKQEITLRAAELEEQQKTAAARLATVQNQESKKLAAVSGEVSSVKNDVGSAKADIQKTQTDLVATNANLVATNAKLERAMGDLGVQSGLIAHNGSELQELKRKGERNYYDFTLQKNARTRVSNLSLVLKKADPKKSTFTLSVLVDDKTVEKKDRTLGEPLQFYTGRDHVLYELVVFNAKKDSVTGYLSTPKSAAQPATP
ncbi:MAG: hypothetical protein WBW69_06035 [Candidatus Korobacteraceae bacterium]